MTKGWYGNRQAHSLASKGIKTIDNTNIRADGVSINQKKINRKMANEIVEFLQINNLGGDLRIYFNDMAYSVDYKGSVEVIYDIKASDYFDYANNDTISMSFEGDFYSVMNGYGKYNWDIQEEFSKILDKYGYYHELGNAWNLALYK